MMVFRRKRGLISVGKVLRVKTRHYMVPPGTALISAIRVATGGFGVPVAYQPVYGAEFGVRVKILNDPRVSDVRSIVFVGPVPVLKNRVKSYYLPMPPSDKVAERIVNAIIDVMSTVSRWGYAGLIIAQSHPRYALTMMSITDRIKYPWREMRSPRVPYEMSILKLAEGSRYGDVITIADGRNIDEVMIGKNIIPRYEIGTAIYDEDITTLVYGYNPYGIRKLIELERAEEKALEELINKANNITQ